jgi:hypothetical protein
MSLARIMLASVVLAGSMVAAPALPVASLSNGETESVEPTIEQPDVDLRATSAVTRIDPDGPFSMVALTWDVDDAPSAVEVRVLAAEGGWSEWTMLDVAEEPAEPGSIEARDSRPSTEPLWTGPSTAVEVKAVDDGGAGTPRLELIDPGVAPQDDNIGQGAPGAANAAVAAPSIVTRQQWGADESLRNCTPRIATSLKAAVVHHTVGSNSYSPTDSAAIVRGIYAFHTKSRGWCDVGYNFLVDRWGNVFEGRSGGVDSPVIGAHTGGFNTGTMGISMMGTFTSAQPPADMLESVARVIAWKFDRAGVDPQANVTLISGGNSKFSSGTPVSVRTISGHRDLYATECPGGVAYQGLQALRDRTEALTASVGDLAVPVVQVSGSADRSDAVVLEGATVAGEMFAFVAPQQGVSGVSFYLDDPALGSPVQVERQAPWDLGGTGAGGVALPFDVSGLAAGEHTLAAVVTTSAGQQTVTATFTVERVQPANSAPTVASGAARAVFESAGFTGSALDVALGVAYAESGGFADAVGDYWQIIPSHTVVAGESLTSIARTYRTTWSELARLNGVAGPDYAIYPGQRLWNPTYNQRFDYNGVRRYPTWEGGWVDPIGTPVWGPSVGLFQVRTLHNPQDYGAESVVRDISGLRDPAFQARAAYVISKGGTDWSPWSVYRSGAYRQYLGTDFEIRTGHPEAARWNLAGTR